MIGEQENRKPSSKNCQHYELRSWLNDEHYKSKLLDFTAYEH